ncbi:hypothetical protein B7494_g616 [Chlorociboria aeruginascens]|nr:hypothetical protein B7494_g616 [Chlorociboria aeruginascens]
MAEAPEIALSDENYASVSRFFIDQIKGFALAEGEGIGAKKLFHLHLDQHPPIDLESTKREKVILKKIIQRMAGDGILDGIETERGVVFRLRSSLEKEDEDETQDTNTSFGIVEDSETMSLDEALKLKIEQILKDGSSKQGPLTYHLTYDLFLQHFRMQRQAKTLALPRSNKRRRTDEIDRTDETSSSTVPNPRSIPSVTPRPTRSIREPSTPQSNRRRSAPTQFMSLEAEGTPTRSRHQTTSLPTSPVKKGKWSPSPLWLTEGLAKLQERYPDDLFEPVKYEIRCLDCARLFNPGPSRNIWRFEQHLRGKAHRAYVEERIAKARPQNVVTAVNSSVLSATKTSIPVPEGGATFQNFMLHMTQYYLSQEQHANSHRSQTNALEERLVTTENQNAAHLEDITARIKHVEKRSKEHRLSATAQIQAFKEGNETQNETIRTIEMTNRDHFERINQLLSSADRGERRQMNRVLRKLKMLESADQTQTNYITSIESKLLALSQTNEERFSEIFKKQEAVELRNQTQPKETRESITVLEANVEAYKNQIDAIETQLGSQNNDIVVTKEDIEILMKSVDQLKLRVHTSSERIRAFETKTEDQNDVIADMKAQYRLLSQQQRSSKAAEETTKKTIEEMKIQFQEMASYIDALKNNNTTQTMEIKQLKEQSKLAVQTLIGRSRDNEEALRKEITELRRDVQRSEARAEEVVSSTYGRIDSLETHIDQSIETLGTDQQELKMLANALAKVTVRMKTVEDNFENTKVTLESQANERIKTLQGGQHLSIESLLHQTATQISELKQSRKSYIGALEEQMEEKIQVLSASYSNQLQALADDLDVQVSTIFNADTSKFQSLESQTDEKIQTLSTATTAQLKSLDSKIDAKLDSLLTTYAKDITALSQQTHTKLRALESVKNSRLDTLSKRMSSLEATPQTQPTPPPHPHLSTPSSSSIAAISTPTLPSIPSLSQQPFPGLSTQQVLHLRKQVSAQLLAFQSEIKAKLDAAKQSSERALQAEISDTRKNIERVLKDRIEGLEIGIEGVREELEGNMAKERERMDECTLVWFNLDTEVKWLKRGIKRKRMEEREAEKQKKKKGDVKQVKKIDMQMRKGREVFGAVSNGSAHLKSPEKGLNHNNKGCENRERAMSMLGYR